MVAGNEKVAAVLHKNAGDHTGLGRLRPPRADRRFAACVQLRGFEPTRGQPRGNFSLAGDLARRDDRTQRRLPHWSEPQRCKVTLGDAGQCACRRPVGRRVDDLHLVCRGIQQLQSNLWLETGVLIGTDRDHQW